MGKRTRRKLASEINVVPYIDVMLVLLIIFMATAPMLMQGVNVELPQANTKPVIADNEEPLIISIKADASLYLNIGDKKEMALALLDVKKKVAAIIRRKPKTPVLIWGDKNVPYGEVVTLMSNLQEAGVPDVGLVTEAQ